MPTLLPGRVTLASIRYQARTRADRWINGAPVNPVYPDSFADSYVTTPELNLMLNASAGELYELMVTQYGNYWFTDEFVIQTDGSSEKYELPKNMLKFLSAEWVQSPTLVETDFGTRNTNNTNNVTLRRFNLQERNVYSYATLPPPMYGVGACLYNVFGSKIWFKPRPQGQQVIQLLYVPTPPLLADTGEITINDAQAGDTITIGLQDGDDVTSTTFTAIAFGGSPTSSQFVIGGTGGTNLGDAGTAASLMATLNASSLGGRAGVLQAYNSSTVLEGTQVQICLTNPAVVVWSSSSTRILLSPNQTANADGDVIVWSNTMTGYAGLEEYLVVDAAIKMMQKEESDVSVLLAQKAALIKRYEGNYANRDAGTPKTATNVRRNLGGWGPFGGGGPGRW
jgi:hypothetical protein